MDNVLKAVAESPYELVVQNKIVVFGGRDLTGFAYGKNEDGSLGEKFTKSTDLESEYTQTGRLYIDFEHGRDPDEIGNNKNNILGFVDWKTAEVVDDGVIVKRVLNRRHKYMKWLEPLIRAGLVGNSSEAIAGQTQKAADGTIEKWPLRRDTLTITPMEPRMVTENTIEAVKALIAEFPEYKSLLPSEYTALPGEDDKPTQPTNSNKHSEGTMEQDEIKAIAKQMVADELAAKAAADKVVADRAAEIKAAEEKAYKQALEDMKANRAPSYHSTDPVDDDNDGVGAFKSWMQTGQTNQGLIRPDSSWSKMPEAKAAWNVTTGESGAFLVPDPLYNQIIAKRNNSSWVRQVPCQYFETSADHLLVPREDTSLTDFVQTAEGVAYNENEGTVSQKDLILYKYTKMTKVNEEFLMYNSTNWESWFANAMGRAVAGTENTIFTTGAGTTAVEGIVTGATVANSTATTDIILPSELTALIGYLGDGYNVESECAFLMKNVTKWYLKGSTLSAGGFAYLPTPQGGDFFGYKAVIDDDLDAYTVSAGKPVIFGNFNYYGVVERPGMMVQRNPYLYMNTGQIGIFASIFRGGGVLQSEAFYYLTNVAG